MVEVRIGAHNSGEALGKFPHLGDIGSAQPVLHGTPDRRSDLEQFDEGIRARKGLFQIGFELHLEAIALRNTSLGDDDHLAKPGVRRLQVDDSTKRGAPVPT